MLPAFKSIEQNLLLFDPSPFSRQLPTESAHTRHGVIRTILGDFCEELTISLLSTRKSRIRRYRTDSQCLYCPDLAIFPKHPRSSSRYPSLPTFLEVKCMGLTNATLLYSGRLVKDAAFASGNRLLYLIYHHRLDTSTPTTVFDLQFRFLRALRALYFFPFESIQAAARQVPETKLNGSYGGAHKSETLYGSGRRIPIHVLKQFPHYKIPSQLSSELF